MAQAAQVDRVRRFGAQRAQRAQQARDRYPPREMCTFVARPVSELSRTSMGGQGGPRETVQRVGAQ